MLRPQRVSETDEARGLGSVNSTCRLDGPHSEFIHCIATGTTTQDASPRLLLDGLAGPRALLAAAGFGLQ